MKVKYVSWIFRRQPSPYPLSVELACTGVADELHWHRQACPGQRCGCGQVWCSDMMRPDHRSWTGKGNAIGVKVCSIKGKCLTPSTKGWAHHTWQEEHCCYPQHRHAELQWSDLDIWGRFNRQSCEWITRIKWVCYICYRIQTYENCSWNSKHKVSESAPSKVFHPCL